MTFDRLLYIDRLKDAGVDEAVARAHAEALRDALSETVATKDDLRQLADTIKAEFRDVDGRFAAMDRKFDAMDRKIEITARDLIIKGAGGLIIIASLIIGLKLFG